MNSLGSRTWVIAGGWIAPESDGPEPELTSREELVVLNSGAEDANVSLTVFYADRDPVGPFALAVAGRRVKGVRVNDLIDPEAVPLGEHYSVVLQADVPVVVQQRGLDSRRGGLSVYSVPAFPAA